MSSFWKRSACIACAAAAALALNGCGKSTETVPTAEEIITLPTAPAAEDTVPTTNPMELVEELTVEMEAGEVYTLDQYPNLKSVDFGSSTCYDTIRHYIDTHPQVEVTYAVSLGGTSVSSKAAGVTLEPGSFDYDLLLENLQYLPNLSTISLPDIRLNAEQVSTLREAYPQVNLDYTVELLGSTYGSDTTQLDLSYLDSSRVEEVLPKLGLLTNLTWVELSNSLSMTDVARLQDSNPGATFRYSFSLFGQTLSTTDETVEYKNYSIGNDGEEKIRQALDILDNCTRFLLDNCKLDNEVLAGIREDYRDKTKVVWRVYFGVGNRYNSLTDADTIRAVYNVTDDTCGNLRYCEDVKYMDIGHNEYLTDLTFVGYMPDIEVLIASGCAVKELVGFENCKKLTWLELAYCYKLADIECLSGCESLTYLNLSYTNVTSFMALDGLPLKRFVCLRPRAATEEQNIFVEIHPKGECITVFYGYSNPYGYGWRYDDNGKTFNEYYKNVVRVAFNYDYLETLLPKDN